MSIQGTVSGAVTQLPTSQGKPGSTATTATDNKFVYDPKHNDALFMALSRVPAWKEQLTKPDANPECSVQSVYGYRKSDMPSMAESQMTARESALTFFTKQGAEEQQMIASDAKCFGSLIDKYAKENWPHPGYILEPAMSGPMRAVL